jgi:CheY-like chemotaxis protein
MVPHLNFDIASQEPMLFNTQALRQIATNALKNAALHSGGHNAWVSLTTEVIDDQTNRMTVRFEDDGKGIPQDLRERVFEAFGRGESQSEGTGLGLFIITELASAVNGSFRYFDSEKGGAGFELVCECSRYTADHSDDDQEVVDPQLLEATLVGKQVLFAEDQLTIQMLTKAQLTKAGANVEACSNGAIALERFKDMNPDLVITDAMMPEMDGYELCRQLRSNGFEGPIIAVTAATIGDERDRLLEVGVDAVLPKPINIDELKLTLVRWEDGHFSA